MEIPAPIIRIVAAGLGLAISGGTYHYTADGARDFEITVHRPVEEVYSAFADTRSVGSGFRGVGIDVPRIETSLSPNRSIVYTMESIEPGKPSRLAFSFGPGSDAITTVVSVAIDVPPIPMPSEGRGMVLSEAKVERKFQDAVAQLGASLDQGNSPRVANAKLAQLIDIVALAADPVRHEAALARGRRIEAEIETAKANLERDGYRVERSGEDQGYYIYNDNSE